MIARSHTYRLNFRFAAGTSRGVLHHKDSTYLIISENGRRGIGECSTITDLSPDDKSRYPSIICQVTDYLNNNGRNGIFETLTELDSFPSVKFGLEMALADFDKEGEGILFDSDFSKGLSGIPINGLVWMGDKSFMERQIKDKLDQGYHCIKLKIGALDFETEISILKSVRDLFSENELEIRVDANGAFASDQAMFKLDKLSTFRIHSIEQPIRQGQWREMAELCKNSPIPIALDEELIAVKGEDRNKLLNIIRPQYVILKPSLLGGFRDSEDWISMCNNLGIQWWVTSALESNVGLSAIAQWTSTLGNSLPQGLGTGQLYDNNIFSPLEIANARLWNRKELAWDYRLLEK